ncbi:TPA: hypothetical protein ACJL6I_001769 [Neisseria meningitidis]|uniref:hypothetical protein n=1 Tax=Neisseria meningitidis TaxID=487 RepID=UPI0012905C96|nr:hypothetical protein [Neisseria meningitidis]
MNNKRRIVAGLSLDGGVGHAASDSDGMTCKCFELLRRQKNASCRMAEASQGVLIDIKDYQTSYKELYTLFGRMASS